MGFSTFLVLAVVAGVLLGNVAETLAARRDRQQQQQQQQRCQRIKTPQCKDVGLPYERTVFPNIFGQDSQKSAKSSLKKWEQVIETGCSAYIRPLLCAAFVPACPRKSSQTLPPCRELCMKVSRHQFFLSVLCKNDWPWNTKRGAKFVIFRRLLLRKLIRSSRCVMACFVYLSNW